MLEFLDNLLVVFEDVLDFRKTKSKTSNKLQKIGKSRHFRNIMDMA